MLSKEKISTFIMRSFLVLLFILIVSGQKEQPTLKNLKSVPLDYDMYPFTISNSSGLFYTHIEGNFNESSDNYYSAYYAIFNPSFFSFYPPTKQGCLALTKTTESSSEFGCEYATNGGFFIWDITISGSLCKGNLISDGNVWQLPTDGSGTGRANFGITVDGNIVTGFINADVIAKTPFSQLLTGWGWLVRNGRSYVSNSSDLSFDDPNGFTYVAAPRTAVGYYKNGSMILLQLDGQEDIKWGPNLFEVAELLVKLGVEGAVNIDGGGSSVSVYGGKYIDFPTSTDIYPEIEEREIGSFACVKR